MIRPTLDALGDWDQIAQRCSANILIVGELAAREREDILHVIHERCGLDVFHPQCPSAFVLPAQSDVILVLDDAGRLSDDQQGQLLQWVGQHDAQITSFALSSLYDMVCAGHFRERLYYHLNTICVMLDGAAASAELRSS
jgi:hypothetical protein